VVQGIRTARKMGFGEQMQTWSD